MSDKPMNGADWAQRVGAREPHGLAEVEAQVLNGAQYTLWRASRNRESKRGMGVLLAVLYCVGILGPLAGATVFVNRENALYLSYNFSTEFGLVAAAVGFVLGLAAQLVVAVEWFTQGRLRSLFTVWYSIGMLICAGATLYLGHRNAGRDNLDAMPYLLPVWLAASIAVLLIVLALSGRARQDPSHLQPGVEVTGFSPRDKRALLADRREALQTLADRGMLQGHDPHELAQLPLGLLAERSVTPRSSGAPAGSKASDPGEDWKSPNSDQTVGADDGTFSFEVDASFNITGRGTVVTGKVTTGSVRVGTDIVVMRDGGEAARSSVVGIEASRITGEVAGVGDEVGLLLADLPRSAVRTGDRIVAAPAASSGQ